MKKIFYLIVTVVLMCGCTVEKVTTGSINGIVTEKSEKAEPMRGTGVELYLGNSLLLRTTTYDDGLYEFNDLHAGTYTLVVDAAGYEKLTLYVVVEAGRVARGDMQLEKINTEMTVRTLDITDIGGNFATLNGSYSSSYSVNECGFVYDTNSTPINGGTKITASQDDNFSKTITNLEKGTYYVQAYATNSRGTEYGEIRSFQIVGNPSVTTLSVTNVTVNAATLNGKIEYAGEPAYTERGFVYSNSSPNPTVQDDASATTKRVVPGTNADFSANITGLTAETTYYVRAYATNSNGTVYGASVSFMDYVVLQSDGIMVQKNDISSGANWTTANNLCQNSRVGGYSDWRLPTIGELATLCSQKSTIGGFADSDYWSSTIEMPGYYHGINFSDNGASFWGYGGNNYCRARCVRTLP
ncbi:MAG: DUF1566 domain-containing protein [Candidatus Azobacteroides sp.]|nr:DUF1566 domain-containing protein [Candidatus Azobacteroides sp.]